MRNSDDQLNRWNCCIDQGAYLFDLKMLCGGYAYFSTFTSFVRFAKFKDRRCERRSPSLVEAMKVSDDFEALSLSFTLVTEQPHYDYWLRRKGWALVGRDFSRKSMP